MSGIQLPDDAVTSVAIMVCTQGPSERRTQNFASLGRLKVASDLSLTIIVVDNNELDQLELISQELSSALAGKFRFETAHEKRPGYCYVRNRALSKALETPASVMIFVDDDHAVEPGLVEAYLSEFDKHDCDIIHGTTVDSLRKCSDGTKAKKVSTYNVAFRRRLVAADAMALRFDTRLNLTGKEDHEFFFDAQAKGAVAIFSNQPLTSHIQSPDNQPPAKVDSGNMAYVEARNATFVARIRYGMPAAMAMFARSFLLRGLLGYVGWVLGSQDARKRARALVGSFQGLWRPGLVRSAAKKGIHIEVND